MDFDHFPSSATCRFYKVYDSFVLHSVPDWMSSPLVCAFISQMLNKKNLHMNILPYQGPEDRTLWNILPIQINLLYLSIHPSIHYKGMAQKVLSNIKRHECSMRQVKISYHNGHNVHCWVRYHMKHYPRTQSCGPLLKVILQLGPPA